MPMQSLFDRSVKGLRVARDLIALGPGETR
jgi:hypothetical protein